MGCFVLKACKVKFYILKNYKKLHIIKIEKVKVVY